jgi:hypothetical protein
MRTRLLLTLPLLLALPACHAGGERSVSEENDRLRQEAQEHAKSQQALQGQIDELKVKLAEATKAQNPLTAEVLEAMPRVTGIDIDSLSGFEPTDVSLPATGVAVWFEPHDGRGRFVQAVGTATIEALVLAPTLKEGENAAPERLAITTLTPSQLRDAYRSSFTGTHYTADLKLDKPLDRTPGRTPSLVIRVEFQDAITGEVLKGERVISPRSPSASPAANPPKPH